MIVSLQHGVQNVRNVEFITNEDRQQLNDLYNRAALHYCIPLYLVSTISTIARAMALVESD
jgi:hypothetical protein